MSLGKRSSGSSLRRISQLQPIAEDEIVEVAPAIPTRSPRRSLITPARITPDDDPEPGSGPVTYPSLDQWRQFHPAISTSPPQSETPKRTPSRYRNVSSSSSSSSGSPPQTAAPGAVPGISNGRYQQQMQKQIHLQQRQQIQQARTPPAVSLSPASSLHASPLAYKHQHRTAVTDRGSDSELSVKKGSSTKGGSSVTENEGFARRGGWLRLGLILGLLALIIVGLTVGLTVGLRKKRTASPDTKPESSSKAGDAFPVGSFAFTAALTEVKSDCTSNPETWQCYPHATYADVGGDSAATFFWVISSSETGYQISSTSNPFSATFKNLAVDVVDEDEYTERFTFEFAMNKTTLTAKPISSGRNNSTADGKEGEGETQGDEKKLANCAYPQTLFQATIWTRVPPQADAGLNISMPDFGKDFGTWPGQVEVWQKTNGGPSCTEVGRGGKVDVEGKDGECGCLYRNFELKK